MQKVVLPNGLTVLYRHKPGNAVIVEVMIKVGSNDELSDELIIGIGSSNEKLTRKNPFSAEERIEMINLALQKHGIKKYKIL